MLAKTAMQVPEVGDHTSKPEGCVEDQGRSTQEGGKAKLYTGKGQPLRSSLCLEHRSKGPSWNSVRQADLESSRDVC